MPTVPPETPLVVLGVVQFSKKLGLAGNALLVLALIVGVAYGLLEQFAPAALVPIVTALLYGLTAAGVYDLVKPVMSAAKQYVIRR